MNNRQRCPGLFVVGTDTSVGKTFVASRIVARLVGAGVKVGVYKPAASGCIRFGRAIIAEDAIALWEASGRAGTLDAVCPQRFIASLAPHLAARAEKKRLDPKLLRSGLKYWTDRSDIVIVEGAGGLMSPLGDEEYVADLAAAFGFPLIVVVPNRIGAINSALLTLIAAAARPVPLPIAGIVLNDVLSPKTRDPSTKSNRQELELRCAPPLLAQLAHRATDFDRALDWLALAKPRSMPISAKR